MQAGFEDNSSDELKTDESKSGHGDQLSEEEIDKIEDEGEDDSPTPEAAENVGKESSTKDENQTGMSLVDSVAKDCPLEGQEGSS